MTSSIEYFVAFLDLFAPEFHARHFGDEEIHIVELQASGSDLHWGEFVAQLVVLVRLFREIADP